MPVQTFESLTGGDELCDKNGNTPLHYAAWNGDIDLMRILISHGADVNAVRESASANKWTPLHVAAENDQPESALLLVDSGANIDAKDEYGTSPLMLAVDEMVSPNVAKMLIKRGADTSGCLEIASRYPDTEGATEVISLLTNLR